MMRVVVTVIVGVEMSKKLFVTDVDGVLLDIDSEFSRFFKQRYGIPIEPKRHWEFEDSLGIPPEEAEKVWEWVWEQRLAPEPGAHAFLDGLRRRGFEIIALTNRKNGDARAASVRDMERVFGGMFDRLVFAGDKEGTKGAIIEKWAAEYFLDDKMSNLWSVRRHSPATKLFLKDQPWNQSQDIDPPYRRIKVLETVLREVR